MHATNLQSGYKLIPLHEYLGRPAPPAAETIEWIPFVSGDETTIEAFKYVNFMLTYTIPNELDKPALEEMARLGIAAGETWDTSKFSPTVKEAIKAGISDALKSLAAYMPTAKSANLFNTREIMGTDYTARALGVQVGIFGNYASQALYFGLNTDADGNEIDTSAADYKISFPAGGTPPARYFWSITMYSLPDRFLVANPLERYSIGSRSPQLRSNADGSIDIYFSKASPGTALESNWLPAPDSKPAIFLRVYGPGESVLSGDYKLPAVIKIN